jgi:hypothetical protein
MTKLEAGGAYCLHSSTSCPNSVNLLSLHDLQHSVAVSKGMVSPRQGICAAQKGEGVLSSDIWLGYCACGPSMMVKSLFFSALLSYSLMLEPSAGAIRKGADGL